MIILVKIDFFHDIFFTPLVSRKRLAEQADMRQQLLLSAFALAVKKFRFGKLGGRFREPKYHANLAMIMANHGTLGTIMHDHGKVYLRSWQGYHGAEHWVINVDKRQNIQ